MEEELKKSVQENGLEQDVIFYGFQPPERVRDVMERCHVHLFTSNYLEGWGAVISEAMNSGCCVVSNAETGAAPFLIKDGKNGLVYNREYEEFEKKLEILIADPGAAERMGREAYHTIAGEWNADCAAQRCLDFYEGWKSGTIMLPESGPLAKAPKLSARWKYDEGRLDG